MEPFDDLPNPVVNPGMQAKGQAKPTDINVVDNRSKVFAFSKDNAVQVKALKDVIGVLTELKAAAEADALDEAMSVVATRKACWLELTSKLATLA